MAQDDHAGRIRLILSLVTIVCASASTRSARKKSADTRDAPTFSEFGPARERQADWRRRPSASSVRLRSRSATYFPNEPKRTAPVAVVDVDQRFRTRGREVA